MYMTTTALAVAATAFGKQADIEIGTKVAGLVA